MYSVAKTVYDMQFDTILLRMKRSNLQNLEMLKLKEQLENERKK